MKDLKLKIVPIGSNQSGQSGQSSPIDYRTIANAGGTNVPDNGFGGVQQSNQSIESYEEEDGTGGTGSDRSDSFDGASNVDAVPDGSNQQVTLDEQGNPIQTSPGNTNPTEDRIARLENMLTVLVQSGVLGINDLQNAARAVQPQDVNAFGNTVFGNSQSSMVNTMQQSQPVQSINVKPVDIDINGLVSENELQDALTDANRMKAVMHKLTNAAARGAVSKVPEAVQYVMQSILPQLQQAINQMVSSGVELHTEVNGFFNDPSNNDLSGYRTEVIEAANALATKKKAPIAQLLHHAGNLVRLSTGGSPVVKNFGGVSANVNNNKTNVVNKQRQAGQPIPNGGVRQGQGVGTNSPKMSNVQASIKRMLDAYSI